MRDHMLVGDSFLFYHSNAKPAGVVGVGKVIKSAEPDVTAWDKKSKYFDPKASPDNPIWECVTVEFERKFDRVVTLDEMKVQPALSDMLVIQKGQRLSIQPVSKREFNAVCKMVNR